MPLPQRKRLLLSRLDVPRAIARRAADRADRGAAVVAAADVATIVVAAVAVVTTAVAAVAATTMAARS